MRRTFIGDVHGKYKQYKRIIEESEHPTIQLGDMGVGFKRNNPSDWHTTWYPNPPHKTMILDDHRFIRGNHDNPSVCRKHSQWIADGHTMTTDLGNKIMFIGGAFSIDRAYRNEGYDWWADEEMSYDELQTLIDEYIHFKPNIMVTHDCPSNIADIIFASDMRFGKFNTRTGSAFEAMFNNHQPDKWLFGHWHISKKQQIQNTNFICLSELETLTLDI